MRSFIRPRKKRLLDEMSLVWLLFIVAVAIGLIVFAIVLNYKSSFYIKMLDSLGQKNSAQVKVVKALEKKIALVKVQGQLAEEVAQSNRALKESMQNLFDLIPDQITLIKVVMKKNELYLKGYAASKDAYRLLLEPPLKSIFTKSMVKFEKDAKGCLVFESRNIMEEEHTQRSRDVNRTQQ